jgi:hypothetical protein
LSLWGLDASRFINLEIDMETNMHPGPTAPRDPRGGMSAALAEALPVFLQPLFTYLTGLAPEGAVLPKRRQVTVIFAAFAVHYAGLALGLNVVALLGVIVVARAVTIITSMLVVLIFAFKFGPCVDDKTASHIRHDKQIERRIERGNRGLNRYIQSADDMFMRIQLARVLCKCRESCDKGDKKDRVFHNVAYLGVKIGRPPKPHGSKA